MPLRVSALVAVSVCVRVFVFVCLSVLVCKERAREEDRTA
jgi:hypothetical protein